MYVTTCISNADGTWGTVGIFEHNYDRDDKYGTAGSYYTPGTCGTDGTFSTAGTYSSLYVWYSLYIRMVQMVHML